MLELRELDFQLALEAARALREDIEDQAVAIEHAPLGELLEIALLAGRERVIDQDHIGAVLGARTAPISAPCRCRRKTSDPGARAAR